MEAKAQAHKVFSEPPYYDSIDYIQRVIRLATRTSLVAEVADGIAPVGLSTADKSDTPPPSYHTEEERTRNSSPSPPATLVVLCQRRNERSCSLWENNSDHQGHNTNCMREWALQLFIHIR